MQLAMPEQAKKPGGYRYFWIVFLLCVLAGTALLYRQKTQPMLFEARLTYPHLVLAAMDEGTVTAVETAEGAKAEQGQILVRLGDAARREALLDARRELSRLRGLIPPSELHVGAQGGSGQGETLAQAHDRQRVHEEAAERLLQEATDNEAQAAVTYTRIAAMAAKGSAGEREKKAAETALLKAREETASARRRFEDESLARAATGAEIRRLKDAQTAAGADKIPVEARLDAYARQRERVALAEAALEAAVIRAPEPGLVMKLLAQPGQTVFPGSPVLLLLPARARLAAEAVLPVEEAGKLRVGQRCEVRLEGNGTPLYPGYIDAILPAPGMPGTPGTGDNGRAAHLLVSVALLDNGAGLDATALPEAGRTVTVTVLANEPPYTAPTAPSPLPAVPAVPEDAPEPLAPAPTPAPAPANAPEPSSFPPANRQDIPANAPEAPRPAPSAPGRAAAPAAPLSVETPFGGTAPVPVLTPRMALPKAEEKSGPREPLRLPPMRPAAPETGAKAGKSPGNNPSIVPEGLLEREASGKP